MDQIIYKVLNLYHVISPLHETQVAKTNGFHLARGKPKLWEGELSVQGHRVNQKFLI